MWLVVGAGLSGAVMAEQISRRLGQEVHVIDSRDHIGGNCYDYIDQETGIRINKYGAHLFHTDDQEVWEYIQKFSPWIRWEHKVLSMVDGKLVPVPVNITTVNTLFDGVHIKDSTEMQQWLDQNCIKHDRIVNSEQIAESRVGRDLYRKMFQPYTIKQWNKDPAELDPSVLARIPIRKDFDTRYFTDKYQGLPKHGYTQFFQNMLDSPLIKVCVNTNFFDLPQEEVAKYQGIIYTGPVDLFFSERSSGGCELEKLEYRSIDFKIERFKGGVGGMKYYQPNSVVNYPELKYPYTRIVEYKHFPNQPEVGGSTDLNGVSGVGMDTVIVSETTNDHGEPYYPVPTERNMALYAKYQKLAEEVRIRGRKVHFLGRLATYKYYNMDQAIRAALDMFNQIFSAEDLGV